MGIKLNISIKTGDGGDKDRERKISADIDGFWDLGKPEKRPYRKPDRVPAVADIISDSPSESTAECADSGNKTRLENEFFTSEKITPRSAAADGNKGGRVVTTIDGSRRVVTSSYKRRPPRYYGNNGKPRGDSDDKKASAAPESVYEPGGLLIKKVEVRRWSSGAEFYGRFLTDAKKSHFAAPSVPYSSHMEEVEYFSYVPQYSHMTLSQIEYYRWFRENVRRGIYPPSSMSYVLLYIFEIINLPGIIPPEEGARLLSAIWINYRKLNPRIDSYLCEWFPDYCLINKVSLPHSLDAILYEVAPKSSFKEFYVDRRPEDEKPDVLNISKSAPSFIIAKTLIEICSDYNYRNSKYYPEDRGKYDLLIPGAISALLFDCLAKKLSFFRFEKIYRIPRDSYCGAIASPETKKILSVEFCSFLRGADVRDHVTPLVKYTENKLRALLGIKARLSCAKAPAEDCAVIDEFFAPLIGAGRKTASVREECDYLKNYEPEKSGLDFDFAKCIESSSWHNAEVLTGENFSTAEDGFPSDASDATGGVEPESIAAGGEPSHKADSEEKDAAVEKAFDNASDSVDEQDAGATDSVSSAAFTKELREALASAMEGKLKEYCRAHSLNEGVTADRINTLFLDILGDIVLEGNGDGFDFIEDYREDAEKWLS